MRETASGGQGPPGPLNSGMAKEGVRAPQMPETELQKAAESLEICEKGRRWQQQLRCKRCMNTHVYIWSENQCTEENKS